MWARLALGLGGVCRGGWCDEPPTRSWVKQNIVCSNMIIAIQKRCENANGGEVCFQISVWDLLEKRQFYVFSGTNLYCIELPK